MGLTSGARAKESRSRIEGVWSLSGAEFGDDAFGGGSSELGVEAFACGSSTVDVSVRWYRRSVEEQPKIPGIATESANITLIARIAKNQITRGRYFNGVVDASDCDENFRRENFSQNDQWIFCRCDRSCNIAELNFFRAWRGVIGLQPPALSIPTEVSLDNLSAESLDSKSFLQEFIWKSLVSPFAAKTAEVHG